MRQTSIVCFLCFGLLVETRVTTSVFDQYKPWLERLHCVQPLKSEEVKSVMNAPAQACANVVDSEGKYARVLCDITMYALVELLCDPRTDSTEVAKLLLNHTKKAEPEELCERVYRELNTPLFCPLCHTELCDLFLWVYDVKSHLNSQMKPQSNGIKQGNQTLRDTGNSSNHETTSKSDIPKQEPVFKGSSQINDKALTTMQSSQSPEGSKNSSNHTKSSSEERTPSTPLVSGPTSESIVGSSTLKHTGMVKKHTTLKQPPEKEILQVSLPSQTSQKDQPRGDDVPEESVTQGLTLTPSLAAKDIGEPETQGASSEHLEKDEEAADEINMGDNSVMGNDLETPKKTSSENVHTGSQITKHIEGFGNAIPVDYLESADNSHFFLYFLSIVGVLLAGFILFRNKQKIIAFIVEGKHERRRRPSSVAYRKLETK